ncbi:MAG: hypothetical protein C4617_04535 [Candidatus Liberibacter europaeus]|uniref:DUF1640 domain-containing protein n=1 Tax=Candidatus Liberibacter europaeus TaxID=744859 RepID=A0A2T4VWX4_9HYPH|nr:hypothetical protein [Candidatus Liberibacter europaeus]PTL86276.1 MAG: hypothetical protein C4617_04535 [Candidatus Liberibacter europaeus]
MTNTVIKQKSKLETALPFLATKADLADVKTELKQDISNVKIELKQDISNTKIELKQDISKVSKEVANVRTELKDAINNQTKWFMGIIVSILVSTIGILLKLSSH